MVYLYEIYLPKDVEVISLLESDCECTTSGDDFASRNLTVKFEEAIHCIEFITNIKGHTEQECCQL